MTVVTETYQDSIDVKVEDYLKMAQLDYTPALTNFVNDAVSAIKDAVYKIPQNLQVTADFAPGFVRDVGADKVDFKFKKPESIVIGGSYAIQCIAKPDVSVDLFVRLPKECFHEKDYLNHRYHAKRCLYLCVIKKYLKLSSAVDKVEWSTFQNEARKPLLVVYPVAKSVEVPGFFVLIIPTATSLFNISKLNLSRNNVHAVNQGGQRQPTPKYNTSILEDIFLEDNADLVKKTFSERRELGNALILLKVWARQRGSIYAHDCLNGFLISVTLLYLSSQKKIDDTMKAVQIFRITVAFLANEKSLRNVLSLSKVSKEEKKQFTDAFPVVVCYGLVNLAFRMSKVGFIELVDEAVSTLKCMEKHSDGGIEQIFMTKIDYSAKYDYYVRLNLKEHSEVYAQGICLDDECWRLYEQKVHGVLNQGLGDRVKLIRVTWRNTHSACSIENGISTLNGEPMLIGITLNNLENAFRMVDIGPEAENKEEAMKYRKFWGEKSELRRFKDGRIAESAVWETKPWTRHLILKNITELVLLRHLSLSKERIVQIVDQLDFSLHNGTTDPICFSGSLNQAIEELSKRLRQIEDIPLKVVSVQALDAAFRSTGVFPPEPHALASKSVDMQKFLQPIPSSIQPLEVMIQLEGSGNWPTDPVLIEKTKVAFLLRIGESLENRWGMKCSATEDDVDIFMSGYAFRLKIFHEKALALLNSGNNQVKRVLPTDKILFLRSQHSSMIHGLNGRFPIYGPVVRLAKRWVAAHLFSACLADEAVELLVAYLFLKHLPFNIPHSRVTGFLRFLRLLAEYQWTFSPLIVDINDDLSEKDLKQINENFKLSRQAYEENTKNISTPMYLATSYDKASEAWTRLSPNPAELKRLAAYAQSSGNLLTKLIAEDQNDSYRWECLFRTPLKNYDAVLLLRRDKLPYPGRLLFPSELNEGRHVSHGNGSKAFHPYMLPEDLGGSTLEGLKDKLLVDFDPLRCFIGDVEKEMSSTLKLWYDSLAGDAIGLTWQRRSSKKRGRQEEEEAGKDTADVLRSVAELGKGFVRDAYLLKSPKLT